jgi:hypothetical protein
MTEISNLLNKKFWLHKTIVECLDDMDLYFSEFEEIYNQTNAYVDYYTFMIRYGKYIMKMPHDVRCRYAPDVLGEIMNTISFRRLEYIIRELGDESAYRTFLDVKKYINQNSTYTNLECGAKIILYDKRFDIPCHFMHWSLDDCIFFLKDTLIEDHNFGPIKMMDSICRKINSEPIDFMQIVNRYFIGLSIRNLSIYKNDLIEKTWEPDRYLEWVFDKNDWTTKTYKQRESL